MTEDSQPFDDDDTPWASPEIRANYEAALGRFILAFNQVDNELTDVIETILRRLKRDAAPMGWQKFTRSGRTRHER